MAFLIGASRLQIQAQENSAEPTTRQLQDASDNQVERSTIRLREILAQKDTLDALTLSTIFARTGQPVRPRSRDLSSGAVSDVPVLSFALRPDASMQVTDQNNAKGLLLTGKWIVDYAKMIKLMPEYEMTLASYRSAVESQKQLAAEFEGTLAVKDQKIAVLQEMRDALQKRGDLYRDLSEINADSWFEKVMHTIAFPAGLTAGIVIGVIISK